MVLRDSNPIQIPNQSGTELIGGTGMTQAQPKPSLFQKKPSLTDTILNAVVGVGQDIADKQFEANTEEAYLHGVATAAKDGSLAELEADPATHAWATAGYQDTQGRKIIAEQAAHIQDQLPLIVDKPDAQERFDALMAEQNRKVTAAIQGMSRTQRAASFAQQATDILAQQKQFTNLRTKAIIQQEQDSITADFSVRRQRLEAAKSDPEQYALESSSFVAALYKNVIQNPKLTGADKQAMLSQAIQYATSSDNYGIYDLAKNTTFDFPDGTKGTLMSQLPMSEQIKLDKSQREAMNRTKGLRSAEFQDRMARIKAELAAGNTNITSYEELSSDLDNAEANGLISPEFRGGMMNNYFTAIARKGGDARIGAMYAAGDYAGFTGEGKTEQQALDAWMQANKDMPYAEKTQALLAIGLNSGMASAFKQVGNLMAAPIAQLGYSKDINPEGALAVYGLVQALDIADKTNRGAFARTMSALDEDGQNMLGMMRQTVQSGITDPETAVMYARSKLEQFKQGGAVVEQARNAAHKADAKIIEEIDNNTLMNSVWSNTLGLFTKNGRAMDQLKPDYWWFEDQTRLSEIRAQSQLALADELNDITQTEPFLPDDLRTNKALARVASRTVKTDSGPLILPKGTDLHQFFGAPQVADQEYIGKAIDELVPKQDGERIVWSTTPDNRITFKRMNDRGEVLPGSGILDPTDVGRKVQDNLDRDAEEAAKEHGPGVVHRVGNAHVQYNGENTAGIPPKQMLELRRTIVNVEGVKNTAYNDGSVVAGNKSFGVGISQTGHHYQDPLLPNGQYHQVQINDSFTAASNDAANLAMKSMAQTGHNSKEMLLFLGTLAYQSPKAAQDPDLLANIQVGNKAGAIKALTNLDAYKNSPGTRKSLYIQQLTKALLK